MQSTENYTVLIDKINTFTRKYYLNNLLRGVDIFGRGPVFGLRSNYA
jgi:hypothetical protein